MIYDAANSHILGGGGGTVSVADLGVLCWLLKKVPLDPCTAPQLNRSWIRPCIV